MPQTKYSAAAGQYAQAVLDLANQQQQAEAIGGELADLKRIIKENPTFESFLRDPAIGAAERLRILKSTLEGRISPLLMNTIGVLNAKRRLGLLPQIVEAYEDLLDAQLGRVEVEVTVAAELDSGALETVRQRVSSALQKDAVIRQRVDESVIGGLVLRIDDRVIDASVKSQLEAIQERLMSAVPR